MTRRPLFFFIVVVGGPLATASACAPAARGTVTTGAVSIESVATPTPKPIPLPPMRTKTLGNGMEVILIENHTLPIVSFGLQFRSGSSIEPADKAGLASLTAEMLREGTATHSADDISERIDFVGGELVAQAGRDFTEVDSWVLRKDFDLALSILADTVRAPAFPQEELDRLRLQAIGDVQSRFDDPGTLAEEHAASLLYGEDDPYSTQPSVRSLKSIRREDLAAFHDRWIVPAKSTLAIAGDVDASVFPKIEAAFADWKAPAPQAEEIPVGPTRPALRLVDKPDLTQSFLSIALPGPTRATKDYFALEALDAVVGDGFTSRLTRVVRTEKGKTYDIQGAFRMGRRRGIYMVSTSTRTAETVPTLNLVLDELAAVARGTKPIGAAELARAKRSLIGNYPRRFETADAVASTVLTARLYGVDLDEVTDYRRLVGEVTVQQVNDAAKRWLDPANAVVVVVGNAAEIKEPLEAARGKAEVMSFLTPTHAIDREPNR